MDRESNQILERTLAEIQERHGSKRDGKQHHQNPNRVAKKHSSTGKTIQEYWERYREQIDQRKLRVAPELPTGIRFLDEKTDGLHKGELWCISGKSGSGKTSLALQIGRNIAETPTNSVLFISLEMKGEQLVGRMFSEMMKIDNEKLRLGIYQKSYADTFSNFLAGIDFEIVEYGYSFIEIVKVIKDYYPNNKPDVIIIDFAQLIAWDVFKDQRLAMESYVRKLAELAKMENIAIILVSQLRRLPSGADYNRPPDMTDLKGTGSLEQLSHVVVLIYRYFEHEVERYILKLAKNRHGQVGETEIDFIGKEYRFKEL